MSSSIAEYSVPIETPRLGAHVMTIQVAPLVEHQAVVAEARHHSTRSAAASSFRAWLPTGSTFASA